MHTAPGDPLLVDGFAEALRLREPDLPGYVLLDFAGFDAWYEEDERNYGHPRDPFHRIDIVRSTRHVVVELDGVTLGRTRGRPRCCSRPSCRRASTCRRATSTSSACTPSEQHSWCAYKGQASYWSLPGADGRRVVLCGAAARGRPR